MAHTARPITFTETEVQSQLPSGWGIVGGSPGQWDAKEEHWALELRDGADNVWTVTVDADEVAKGDRIGALAAKIRRLERKGLGRKSIISG